MKSSFDLNCLNWKTNQRLVNFPFCDSEFSLLFLSFCFCSFLNISFFLWLNFRISFFSSLYFSCFSYFLFLLFFTLFHSFGAGIFSFISFLSFFLFYRESWIFPEFSFILLLFHLVSFCLLPYLISFLLFTFLVLPSSWCPSLRFSCCGPEEPEDQDVQRRWADHQGRQFCFHPCAESADHMLRGGAHQPETGLD